MFQLKKLKQREGGGDINIVNMVDNSHTKHPNTNCTVIFSTAYKV